MGSLDTYVLCFFRLGTSYSGIGNSLFYIFSAFINGDKFKLFFGLLRIIYYNFLLSSSTVGKF